MIGKTATKRFTTPTKTNVANEKVPAAQKPSVTKPAVKSTISSRPGSAKRPSSGYGPQSTQKSLADMSAQKQD